MVQEEQRVFLRRSDAMCEIGGGEGRKPWLRRNVELSVSQSGGRGIMQSSER